MHICMYVVGIQLSYAPFYLSIIRACMHRVGIQAPISLILNACVILCFLIPHLLVLANPDVYKRVEFCVKRRCGTITSMMYPVT